MLKWIKAVYMYAITPPVKAKESELTKVIGFNDPTLITPPIKSIEVSARCKSCLTTFKQTLYNVYAIKNSLYEYDNCTACTDIMTQDPSNVSVNEYGDIKISKG